MVEKTNKLNICFVKTDYTAFDQIVKAGTPSIGIDGVGMFYVEESYVRRPSWVADFFGNALDGKFKLLNASSKGRKITKLTSIGSIKSRIYEIGKLSASSILYLLSA